jgi:signal transduction histidine kinase
MHMNPSTTHSLPDPSKIAAGNMGLEIDRFDVKPLIAEVANTVRTLVQKNRNVLTVRCAADAGTMQGDLTKTRQILLNLLSNAGKFTSHGSVAIDVRRGAINGEPCIEFCVTDTGVGMTEEETRKVFEPFPQADVTATCRYGSTGLSLAIVSRFCKLMGGTVSVESRPGVGSRFTVRLPAAVVDRSAESLMAAGVL